MSENCISACFYVTTNVMAMSTLLLSSYSLLQVTSSRVCLNVLIYFTFITPLHTHIYRPTHTSTHVRLAYRRNCENKAQEPGWKGRKQDFSWCKRLNTYTRTQISKKFLNYTPRPEIRQDLSNRASSKDSRLFLMNQ